MVTFGGVSVSAQDLKPVLIEACPPADLNFSRVIIRVLKAEVVTDESGYSAYKINANESWRRTEDRKSVV